MNIDSILVGKEGLRPAPRRLADIFCRDAVRTVAYFIWVSILDSLPPWKVLLYSVQKAMLQVSKLMLFPNLAYN